MNRWISLQHSFGFAKAKSYFCNNIQVHSMYVYIYIYIYIINNGREAYLCLIILDPCGKDHCLCWVSRSKSKVPLLAMSKM
jgi:hypothetical protein